MALDPGGTDDISPEARLMAALVRARAAQVPLGGDLAVLTADALLTPGRDMTADEIRRLGASAVEQARQISYLLGKLAGLLNDDEDRRDHA